MTGDDLTPEPADLERAGERPTGALLEARGLSAGYGSLAAVRDLDLHVGPGEVVALLGPNGAGKTTTLRTLAGALRPLAGEVIWKGRPRARRCTGGRAWVWRTFPRNGPCSWA